jgi:hypothetical protein
LHFCQGDLIIIHSIVFQMSSRKNVKAGCAQLTVRFGIDISEAARPVQKQWAAHCPPAPGEGFNPVDTGLFFKNRF